MPMGVEQDDGAKDGQLVRSFSEGVAEVPAASEGGQLDKKVSMLGYVATTPQGIWVQRTGRLCQKPKIYQRRTHRIVFWNVMGPSEGRVARVEDDCNVQRKLKVEITAGMDSVVGKQLHIWGLEICLDTRAIMGEAEADVELLTPNLKPDATITSMKRMEARKVAREDMKRLESQMERVQAARMARLNRDALYSSLVMSVPMRGGFRMLQSSTNQCLIGMRKTVHLAKRRAWHFEDWT